MNMIGHDFLLNNLVLIPFTDRLEDFLEWCLYVTAQNGKPELGAPDDMVLHPVAAMVQCLVLTHRHSTHTFLG